MKNPYLKLRKNIVWVTLIFSVFFCSYLLSSCGDQCKDCLHGRPDNELYSCECICDSGWVGNNCDVAQINSVFDAAVYYPNFFSYKAFELELKQKINPMGDDTLIVNAKTTFDEWFHLRLIVNDLNTVNHKTYFISQTAGLNQVWITHQHPGITNEVFTPISGFLKSGYLTIDSLNTVTSYLDAKFEARLSVTSGDTCAVRKGIIQHR
jgi:hypothetical protein